MSLVEGLITISVIHLLAAASPGPDFVMVTQQSLTKGRKAGILCSLGIALGLSVHIVYSSIGLASLISQSTLFLVFLKFVAAGYLIYLGIKGVCSKTAAPQMEAPDNMHTDSSLKLVTLGFLCNVLNPKAPLYFLSVFTIVLSPEMPLYELFLYGAWMMTIQFVWFSAVALLLSKPSIKSNFLKIGHWVDRAMGSIMLVFGVRLLISKSQ